MGSLVELSRIAKNDAYIVDGYSQPRKRISGDRALMGAGAATAGTGAVIVLRSRKIPVRAHANATAARNDAAAATRAAGKGPRQAKAAIFAQSNAKLARMVANESPARAKYVRRLGGKIAAVGAGVGAAGYGLKRLNDGA